MRKKLSRSHSDKRANIIAAATEAFLQGCYQNTSMETIASQAGVAKQTLYNHFGNKDALFSAVVSELCQHDTKKRLLSVSTLDRDAEAVLREYAEYKLSGLSYAENAALYRMVTVEALRFPELGRQFFKATLEEERQLLEQFIQHQHQTGKLQVDDPSLAARFFQSALNSYFHICFIMTGEAASRTSIQKHIDYCIEKFLLLYRPS